ncbi:hypothetical protein [Colwellia psychrerythraea]|nr:hypothetical protein [Colwellia psychrerythraea]
MFQLKKTNIVWWPVTINEPVDGGKVTEFPCQIQFELLDQKEFDELSLKGDIVLLSSVVKGWQEILGANKKDLPFTKKNIDAFLQVPYVRASLFNAYLGAVSGAPVKN